MHGVFEVVFSGVFCAAEKRLRCAIPQNAKRILPFFRQRERKARVFARFNHGVPPVFLFALCPKLAVRYAPAQSIDEFGERAVRIIVFRFGDVQSGHDAMPNAIIIFLVAAEIFPQLFQQARTGGTFQSKRFAELFINCAIASRVFVDMRPRA